VAVLVFMDKALVARLDQELLVVVVVLAVQMAVFILVDCMAVVVTRKTISPVAVLMVRFALCGPVHHVHSHQLVQDHLNF
jgi:hypothetical protein